MAARVRRGADGAIKGDRRYRVSPARNSRPPCPSTYVVSWMYAACFYSPPSSAPAWSSSQPVLTVLPARGTCLPQQALWTDCCCARLMRPNAAIPCPSCPSLPSHSQRSACGCIIPSCGPSCLDFISPSACCKKEPVLFPPFLPFFPAGLRSAALSLSRLCLLDSHSRRGIEPARVDSSHHCSPGLCSSSFPHDRRARV